MDDHHHCPRRSESPMSGNFPGPDVWRERDGYRHCSYCGSLHPAHLFEAVEAGQKITPTDKNYKIYVDLPDPRQGEPRVVGIRNFPPAESERGWQKIEESDLPALLADGFGAHNLGHWMQRAPRGPTLRDKFYFQHLDGDQQQRFIDLLNAGKLNLAYPGHFYVLPFFAARKAAE